MGVEKGSMSTKKGFKGFNLDSVSPDQTYGETLNLFGLIFGMAGLFMRSKFFCLQSLVCLVMALANTPIATRDLKQSMMQISFAVMGLFMNYRLPAKPKA